MNISLPKPMRDWVQGRVYNGGYASASDYMRDLIRRDQADADQRQALINALVGGEQTGTSERNVTDILAAIREEAIGCV